MTNSDQIVRIGLIGAGAIMRLSHAPTIKASSQAKLVAIFDTNLKNAEALSTEFGGDAYDNLDKMLERKDLDAVIVATPNKFHAEGVIKAATYGKHIFCEKPISVDVADARKMVEAAEKNNVILQVGFNQRFWKQVQIAKQLVDEGFIGKIHQARTVYSEKASAYPASTGYRYNLDLSGGATIIDLTVHRIDLLRHLVGDFTSVFAELVHSELPEKVDDNVALLAKFDTGARGILTGNRFSPNIGDGTDLYGTEGTIHIASETISPFQSVPLAIYTEKSAKDLPEVLQQAFYPEAWWKQFDGGWLSIKPERINPYRSQLSAFCNSILTGSPALITGVDGLKAQEVIQASYKSMRTGQWVDLPLDEAEPFIIPEYK